MRPLVVVNRVSGERLVVELEIGPLLWLRSDSGDVEQARIEHLPAERWAFMEAGGSYVDLSQPR